MSVFPNMVEFTLGKNLAFLKGELESEKYITTLDNKLISNVAS